MQIQALEDRFELDSGVNVSDQDSASYDFVFQKTPVSGKQHASLPARDLDEASCIEIIEIEGIKAEEPQVPC